MGPYPDDDRLTIWTVYKNPSDYPGKWVLRGHDIGSGTVDPRPDCVVADSYEEIVAQLPRGLAKIQRDPNDDPVIYETWL